MALMSADPFRTTALLVVDVQRGFTALHPGFVALLRAEGVEAVTVCGIATNICCFYAARDLRRAGFAVSIVEDASAGIDVPAAGLFQAQAREEGIGLGIRYMLTAEV